MAGLSEAGIGARAGKCGLFSGVHQLLSKSWLLESASLASLHQLLHPSPSVCLCLTASACLHFDLLLPSTHSGMPLLLSLVSELSTFLSAMHSFPLYITT